MMAIFSENLAIFGRCSLILTPAVLVAISLKLPPLAWPGLRSHRSMVDGPPDIHSRMHCLRLTSGAAECARRSNQPDMDAPRTPAADSLSRSRRLTRGADMVPPRSGQLSAVSQKKHLSVFC